MSHPFTLFSNKVKCVRCNSTENNNKIDHKSNCVFYGSLYEETIIERNENLTIVKVYKDNPITDLNGSSGCQTIQHECAESYLAEYILQSRNIQQKL